MTYRVAFKLVGDKDAVCDIVQEVFTYLFEKQQKNEKVIHYSSWLYRATYNKCIDYLKLQSKSQPIKVDIETVYEEHNIENKERKKLLTNALNQLKPDEKFMAILYSEGLSYKEISEVSGVKFTSIGKTLSRILKKLEKELKGKQYELFG